MRRVLGCYLRRRVAGQMLGTLAVLAGLMQLLELLDVTTDILDRDLGFSGIVRYALLRLPAELVVALPLAVLLGAMSTFFAMARSHEITALRSAGVSMSRLLRHLLPVPLLFAVLQLALTQGIVPLTESNLKVVGRSRAARAHRFRSALGAHQRGARFDRAHEPQRPASSGPAHL